jgi:hypothetical protein
MSRMCDHIVIIVLFLLLIICCLLNIFVCDADKEIRDNLEIHDYIIMNFKDSVKI